MKALLERLHLRNLNPGACAGPDGWIADPSRNLLTSYNPSTGEAIATVVQAGPATYDEIVENAKSAFLSWRMLPAPKRGLVVRDLATLCGTIKNRWARWLHLKWARSAPKVSAKCRR